MLCTDFPIVIIYEKEGHSTLAILTGDASNQAITKEGKWKGEYIPAFVRRYPFTLVEHKEDATKLELGFDIESGCFSSPEGEVLFDADGKPSAVINDTLKYLEALHKEMQVTNTIIQKFAALDILTESQYSIAYEDKESKNVGGFWVVDKSKLLALPDETLVEAVRNGWMELIELQVLSLKNIKNIR